VSDSDDERWLDVVDAWERIEHLPLDFALLDEMLQIRPRDYGHRQELAEYAKAVRLILTGAELATRWPGGNPVRRPLTPRQVIALASMRGGEDVESLQQTLARYGPALNEWCPYCNVDPGQLCRSNPSGWTRDEPHAGRRQRVNPEMHQAERSYDQEGAEHRD